MLEVFALTVGPNGGKDDEWRSSKGFGTAAGETSMLPQGTPHADGDVTSLGAGRPPRMNRRPNSGLASASVPVGRLSSVLVPGPFGGDPCLRVLALDVSRW